MSVDDRSPRPPHPATLPRGAAVQPRMAQGAPGPHPATVPRGTAVQPKMATEARPPHPATVPRGSAVQPRMASDARPPHPATGLPPRSTTLQARKGLKKDKIDPWTALKEALETYSPDSKDWVPIAQHIWPNRESVPVIRGHGTGNKGSGTNDATDQDIKAFLDRVKELAELRWGVNTLKKAKAKYNKEN